MLDPHYLKLYRQYVKSMRAYDIALKKRREWRARWRERKNAQPVERRPVGSPPGYRRTEEPAAKRTAPVQTQRETKIYLGDILGWAKVIPTPQLEAGPDPTNDFDVDAVYDRVQLRLYWNAKMHYEKCKREFFDYARKVSPNRKVKPPKQNFRNNLDRARGHAQFVSDLQFLGVDEKAADSSLKMMKLEVETACYKAWENYRNNPESYDAKKDLVDVLVDAFLVGNDDSPIVNVIDQEIIGRHNDGKW